MTVGPVAQIVNKTVAKSAKEKANFKLRQFKRCGWLEEDNSEGFSVFVSMTDNNAIALMETFKNLISKRNRPLEYTGYFYVIYETLRNFDYHKSKALIEQVVKNTTEIVLNFESEQKML